MGALTLEQLGKYEAHYVKKNGGIGALESLLGGIDNENEIEEIRSIAYSMYEEFHSDQKKRIIRNITIISTVTMSAAFGVFLLIRHLNPIVDIKLPIEVVSLTLAATCLLMLCYQLIKYESIEYRFDNRCSNEQDDSKTSMIQANDSNDIVTLKTRLKRLTDCVRSDYINSCDDNNPQMIIESKKLSGAPMPPPMPDDSKKLQKQVMASYLQSQQKSKIQDEMNHNDELRAAVEIRAAKSKKNWLEHTLGQEVMTDQQNQQDGDDFPPPPSLCDDFKGENTSTWTSEKPILDGVRDR
ncbi:hypothetical protein [Candidatus Mesenet endosymbiont of Agriotes lineatus]|uniref:hypothetical protein n=1 Tax=Candidatus Mesenet endosymbiont of Agriotes lineatus TaxID=3077948 RepID=UPI0030D0D5A2